VLDDKRPQVRAQLDGAPVMTDYLCEDCAAHHARVRELLAVLGIPFTDAPRLVRGLDYYNRTTYEFEHALLGAQSGIGGGGRYDGLSEDIGGPRRCPASGSPRESTGSCWRWRQSSKHLPPPGTPRCTGSRWARARGRPSSSW